MHAFSRQVKAFGGDAAVPAPLRGVSGLGGEAYARYSEVSGRGQAKVVMCARETVATVVFDGARGHAGGGALPEPQVMPPVLRVAREVGSDRHDLPQDEAIDGAYTAAEIAAPFRP